MCWLHVQTSLRPILVNLAYYNKLKLPLLRGLARLLKLLASWFNVTLGAASITNCYHAVHEPPMLGMQRVIPQPPNVVSFPPSMCMGHACGHALHACMDESMALARAACIGGYQQQEAGRPPEEEAGARRA